MDLKELLTDLNESNLKELYITYKKSIFLFVLGIVKDYNLCEDITEEVFLRIIKYCKSYDKMQNPKTWIFTIAKNTAYTYLSKNKEVCFDDNQLEFIINKHNSIKNDTSIVVEEYLSHLTEIERNIVVLHIFGGLKHHEIAKILNIKSSQVRTKYAYALKKLKRRIYEKK